MYVCMILQFQVAKNLAIVILHSSNVLINDASMPLVYVTVWTIVETTLMNWVVVSEQYMFCRKKFRIIVLS